MRNTLRDTVHSPNRYTQLKSRVLISLIIAVLSLHVSMLILSEYSFVGYLSDTIIPILLIGTLFILFKRNKIILHLKNRFVFYSFVIIVLYGFIGIKSIKDKGIFSTLNSLDVAGFHYYRINNNFYNGYFESVGAYSGGEGNIWISKTPLLFLLIEKTIYHERAVMWDYSLAKFEDEKVDQNKIMRQTILEKLTNK